MGVFLLTTTLVAQQEFTIEVLPGVIVIEKDYAWMCFPPNPEIGQLLCVKVHKSKFCPTEAIRPGVLKCFEEMMAEEKA